MEARRGSIPRPVEALPWGSQSITTTLRPRRASAAARLTTVVVLPTPPFWFARATALCAGSLSEIPRRFQILPPLVARLGANDSNPLCPQAGFFRQATGGPHEHRGDASLGHEGQQEREGLGRRRHRS